MTRFRQLAKCKFWQVRPAAYFWTGPPDATGMRDLRSRYCKTMVRVTRLDPDFHDPDEWCPAGTIGERAYQFSPGEPVWTFKSCVQELDESDEV